MCDEMPRLLRRLRPRFRIEQQLPHDVRVRDGRQVDQSLLEGVAIAPQLLAQPLPEFVGDAFSAARAWSIWSYAQVTIAAVVDPWPRGHGIWQGVLARTLRRWVIAVLISGHADRVRGMTANPLDGRGDFVASEPIGKGGEAARTARIVEVSPESWRWRMATGEYSSAASGSPCWASSRARVAARWVSMTRLPGLLEAITTPRRQGLPRRSGSTSVEERGAVGEQREREHQRVAGDLGGVDQTRQPSPRPRNPRSSARRPGCPGEYVSVATACEVGAEHFDRPFELADVHVRTPTKPARP